MATHVVISAEEFGRMDFAEGQDVELMDGELIPMSTGTPLHNRIRGRLEKLLGIYFDGGPTGGALGETNCQMSEDTVLRPDVAVFLAERWSSLDRNKTPVAVAPDIAVEVLSPSERAMHVTQKVREYLQAGVQEIWLMDPQNIEVQVRNGGGIRVLEAGDGLESPLLPGFSARVTSLLEW